MGQPPCVDSQHIVILVTAFFVSRVLFLNIWPKIRFGMHSAVARSGGGCVELVIKKTENGWKWVVEGAGERRRDQNWSWWKARSLDSVEPCAGAKDPAAHGMTAGGEVIPSIWGAAEQEWWKNWRGDPKRSGEISQAAFLLKARMMGYSVAIPWGDSERYDFVVWAKAGGPVFRVQVKGTGRLHRRGYEVQPVRSTRGRGKKRYTKRDIDVIAAHVQPVDAWSLIPIENVGRAKSLRFYPDIKSRRPMWEEYREAWEVLGEM